MRTWNEHKSDGEKRKTEHVRENAFACSKEKAPSCLPSFLPMLKTAWPHEYSQCHQTFFALIASLGTYSRNKMSGHRNREPSNAFCEIVQVGRNFVDHPDVTIFINLLGAEVNREFSLRFSQSNIRAITDSRMHLLRVWRRWRSHIPAKFRGG